MQQLQEFLSSYNVISPTSAAGAVALTDGDYTTELSVPQQNLSNSNFV